MAHQETETKLAVGDPRALLRRIKALGFAPSAPRRIERNQLFDFPGGRLRAAGMLVRLRECGGEWRLTVKAPATVAGGIKSRPEYETALADPEPLRQLLKAAGLAATWYYEKFRREFKRGRLHLFFDETPAGVYLEIEGPHAAAIGALATRLGFSPTDFISDSYFTLWARRCGDPRPPDMRFPAAKKARGAARGGR